MEHIDAIAFLKQHNTYLKDMMQFDKDKLEELRKLYLNAVKEDKSSFKFEDKDMFTGYAKYVIEYLDSKFHPKK